MTLSIEFKLTPESLDVIQQHKQRPRRLRTELAKALRRGLGETETHLKQNHLSGTYTGKLSNGSSPVNVRSGTLRQSITSKRDEPLSGFVGVAEGPASRYARTVLGDGETVIRPRRSKYLAIPVADGLTASGQPRFPGGPRSVKGLRLFMSKAGNLVGFLATGGVFKRGAKKGRAKGKLLFVFKRSVTVKGTDALAQAVNEKRERIGELLREGMFTALNSGASGGGGSGGGGGGA